MANEFIKLDNELNIKFKIKPKSPLLIKLGDGKEASKSESLVHWLNDKTEMDTDFHPKSENGKVTEEKRKGSLLIPGSSLKGLFRERFTQIWYDYKKEEKDKINDFLEYEKFEEDLEKKINSGELKSEDVYNENLKIGKLFGSKVLKARFFAQDAYLENKEKFTFQNLKERSITPIDRFTGGAIVPLHFEYTTENFEFDLIIKNVEKEELQNIFFVIRDSINGEIRLGNSKTRGFGEIEFEIKDFYIKKFKDKSEYLDKFESFFKVDEKKSMKIKEQFLYKTLELKETYKKIDIKNPNEFILKLFEGDK